MAIFTGHHSLQAGKLGILDPSLGRQENLGAQLIAPVRATPAEHIDRYGQEGDLFKYPYPLDAEHFLVSYAPLGWENTAWEQQMNRPAFGLYAMDMTGRRELLYLDTEKGLSVGRMAPLRRNDSPHLRPTNVDYRKDTGIYQIQDIYIGAGLKGVPRGTVKALRVVALDYRAAGIGWNSNKGIAGGALVSTPVAIGKGCWDVKIPLGRAKVYEDGSALFSVAARTPLYFQALDEKGRVIQTMRSWSTLQPGEKYSCVGCHEDKNAAPPADGKPTLAMRAGIQALDAPGEGFSFGKQIQPILDTHCITCHYDNSVDMTLKSRDGKTAFSLLGTISEDTQAKRYWSHAYLNLTQDGPEAGLVRWMSTQSAPPVEAPYSAGSVRSPLMDVLEKGHHNVRLSPQELETFACWIDLGVPFCGDYAEAAAWTGEEQAKYAHYLQKRRDMERVEADNVRDYLESRP
jgi:hypothetical protein